MKGSIINHQFFKQTSLNHSKTGFKKVQLFIIEYVKNVTFFVLVIVQFTQSSSSSSLSIVARSAIGYCVGWDVKMSRSDSSCNGSTDENGSLYTEKDGRPAIGSILPFDGDNVVKEKIPDIARRGKNRKSVAGEYVLKSPMLKYSEKKVGKDIRTFFFKINCSRTMRFGWID